MHRQTKTFRNTFESFSQSPKKTLVCFSRFSLFARARKQANAHVHFEREREKRKRAENKNRKSKKEELQTSERLRERTLPRCRDLSLDKVVRRRLKSIDQSINRSIDKIENSVLPQCFSRSPPPPPSSPSSPLAPASPVADSEGHLPAETKKNQQFKK